MPRNVATYICSDLSLQIKGWHSSKGPDPHELKLSWGYWYHNRSQNSSYPFQTPSSRSLSKQSDLFVALSVPLAAKSGVIQTEEQLRGEKEKQQMRKSSKSDLNMWPQCHLLSSTWRLGRWLITIMPDDVGLSMHPRPGSLDHWCKGSLSSQTTFLLSCRPPNSSSLASALT